MMTPQEQKALARKYDVNLTWHFAEIEPGLFALFNPIHRDLECLGTIEEVLVAYRARKPYVHQPRTVATAPKGKFAHVNFNI